YTLVPDRSMPRHLLKAACALAALTTVTLPQRAVAYVGGFQPQVLQTIEVQGSADTTGASLMLSNSQVNYAVLEFSTANLNNFPADGTVASAFLFWSASATAAGADNEVSFVLPNNDAYMNLRTDQCQPGENPCDLSKNRCVSTFLDPGSGVTQE